MKTLEILIPTYMRPESAADAMLSCLAVDDDRISVRCNSNGYEPSLERFRDLDSRLTYSCFESNRGVRENFLFLLRSASAKYCMLLSDEDRLDPAGIRSYIDYLDACLDRVGVISCSVYNFESGRYYYYPNPVMDVEYDLSMCLALGMIPSYMSGLTYNVEKMRLIDLDNIFEDYQDKGYRGNVYAQNQLAYSLLVGEGLLKVYTPILVLKGADVKFGGDGYSHRKNPQEYSVDCLDLNPFIYGPRARTIQYFYESYKLNAHYRCQMGILSFVFAQLLIFNSFITKIFRAHSVVSIPESTSVISEVQKGARFSKELCGVFSKILYCVFFIILLLPRFTQKVFLFLSQKLVGIVRRLYHRFMGISKKFLVIYNSKNQ